jgi:hypothetical protein
MPPTIVLQGRSRTWQVGDLVAAIRGGGREWRTDEHAYVLFYCRNGMQAIVRIESDGSLAKAASYVQVS